MVAPLIDKLSIFYETRRLISIFHKSGPLYHILSQIYSVQNLSSSNFKRRLHCYIPIQVDLSLKRTVHSVLSTKPCTLLSVHPCLHTFHSYNSTVFIHFSDNWREIHFVKPAVFIIRPILSSPLTLTCCPQAHFTKHCTVLQAGR